jgi:hypothetical protein
MLKKEKPLTAVFLFSHQFMALAYFSCFRRNTGVIRRIMAQARTNKEERAE